MAEPFIAEVRMWACNYAPRGWAFCDGATLQIASNTALFALIGTTYGGDGRTTMGLPNLIGRAPMQWGDGPGLTNRFFGEFGGSALAFLTPAQIPSHYHILTGMRESGTSGTPTNELFMGVDRGNTGADNMTYLYQDKQGGQIQPDATMSSLTLSTAGGSELHENRQPYLTMNFCIAMTGLFPSRN